MNDLVFEQLQAQCLTIDDYTLNSFGPVSISTFDKSFASFSDVTTSHQTMFQQVQEMIKLNGFKLQDHVGCTLDDTGLTLPHLILHNDFFGVSYKDTDKKSIVCSRFHPSDIVAIVREGEKAMYLKFCKPLSVQIQDASQQLQYHNDSRLSKCLAMILFFYEPLHVAQVFDYISHNSLLMQWLRNYYPKVMLLSSHCTLNDVHLLCQEKQVPTIKLGQLQSINVQAACVLQRCEQENDQMEEEESIVITKLNHISISEEKEEKSCTKKPSPTKQAPTLSFSSISTPTQHQRAYSQPAAASSRFTWAKTAALQLKDRPKSNSIAETSSKHKSSTIDMKKIHLVLPPSFCNIDKDVQDFALTLLAQGKLFPYQITAGLCDAIAVVNTESGKMRARSILNKLSENPNIQLCNVQNVGRFILEGTVTPQNKHAKGYVEKVVNSPVLDGYEDSIIESPTSKNCIIS
jgi:hypothetical protein